MMKLPKIIALLSVIVCHHWTSAQVFTNSANVNLTAGSSLILNSTSLENNNIITAATTSNVILKGTQSIKISGSQSLSFGTVKVENGQGVVLFNPLIVKKDMIFEAGILTPKNGSYVLFENGATSTVNSDNSFVNGKIKKVGISSFDFNVGQSSIGRPLGISELTGTDTITVQYFKVNPNDSGYNIALREDSLKLISQCEYWSIDGTSSANAKVTITWDGTESCGVGVISDLRLAQWDGAQWVNQGATNVSGNTNAGQLSAASSASLIGQNIYTLGSISINNPLPIELNFFIATLEGDNTSRLEWETLSESNSDYFIIEKSIDGVFYTELDRVDASGTSNHPRSYYLIDDNLSNINHYALQLMDLDGNKEFIANALLINKIFQKTQFKIGNNFIEMPETRNSSTVRFSIYDLKGSLVLDEFYGLGTNIDFLEIMPPDGLNGIYIGQLTCGEQMISKKIQFAK